MIIQNVIKLDRSMRKMQLKERRQNAWKTIVIIMSLAWPTIVEQVMATAVQYIDTAMVARWAPMPPLRWVPPAPSAGW